MHKRFLVSGLLAGALFAGGATAADMAAFQKAYDAAKATVDKADSVGGEWRDTGKMMKKAKMLALDGKFDEAIKEADKAKFQGEAGYAQAMAEKNAGHPSYLVEIEKRRK